MRIRAATLEHEYQLFCGAELLAEARVQLCCVDRAGNPQRWPEWMTINEAATINEQVDKPAT